VVTDSVLKHGIDPPDNLGVADLAIGGGAHYKHCKLAVFTSV